MKRFVIELSTEGRGEIVDLNPMVAQHAKDLSGEGLLHLFVPGSTAAITTVEYEPGLVKHDLPRLFSQLAPDNATYFHEQTWKDDNGHSHVLATLFGPQITVPFAKGRVMTGEWQQIVLIDFDTRPRRRRIICTVMA